MAYDRMYCFIKAMSCKAFMNQRTYPIPLKSSSTNIYSYTGILISSDVHTVYMQVLVRSIFDSILVHDVSSFSLQLITHLVKETHDNIIFIKQIDNTYN